MPVDPNVELLLSAMAQGGQGGLSDLGVEQARAMIEQFDTFAAGEKAQLPRIEALTCPGPEGDIPLRLYSLATEEPLPVVVYFHGGGWVIGNIESHDFVCRKLAYESGLTVISVEYRLAPEHTFPSAAEDCYAVAKWVADNAEQLKVDGSRLAVAGDSAGGNLAAVTSLMARDRGEPQISFQLLVYPVVDGTMSFPSIKENAEGYLLTAKDMVWFYDHYAPEGVDRKSAYLSPLYAPDLTKLPPALVITAEYDPLRDEGEAYADALQQAGVEARSSRYDGMIHGFFGLDAIVPAAAPAMEEAAASLKYWLR